MFEVFHTSQRFAIIRCFGRLCLHWIVGTNLNLVTMKYVFLAMHKTDSYCAAIDVDGSACSRLHIP